MTVSQRRWRPSALWWFLLPSLVLMLIFFFIPILITAFISLTGLDYRLQWTFMGLANFTALFADTLLPKILLNTAIYVFVTLFVFYLGLGLFLALATAALSERAAVALRLVWLLPRFTPVVVYILLWRLLLDPTPYGLLNRVRQLLLGAAPLDWLTQYPWSAIIVVNGLTGVSLGLIIFTAAIESIPRDLLRAARLDGASTFDLIWRLLLPLLRWPLTFVTTYQTLSLLASFEAILLLTNGGPFYATEVWTLHAYHRAFEFSEFGYGAAMTFVVVLLGVGTSLGYWRLLRFQSQLQTPPIEND